MHAIVPPLREEAYRFDFYQAVRLLEECAARESISAKRSRRLRISANPATTFPAADVAGVTQGSGGTRLLLSCMGLAGAASPLPSYFVQAALADDDAGAAMRAFLDMFNGRLYELLYQAWSKRRFGALHKGRDRSPAARIIRALAGAAHHKTANAYAERRAAFAGVLAGGPRSAEGLRVLLSGWLDGAPVRVRQRVARWTACAAPLRLGSRQRIGDSAVLGERYLDTDGFFMVDIGPLDKQRYDALLPSTPLHRELSGLIASYLSRPLTFEISVLLDRGEMRAARLGEENAQLGRNTLLGHVATGPRTN